MPASLIPLLIEYSIKYGVPAVVALIDTIQKENITWEEIQAAFKVAETPYGLTAEIVTPAPTPPTPPV